VGAEQSAVQHTPVSTRQDYRNPCTAFFTDLAQYIQESHAAGNQLVIGADFNTDTNAEAFLQWAQSNQLCNILQYRHGQVPSTNLRSVHAIDAILVSASLAPFARGGLLSSTASCGNDGHLPLWISISHNILFGSDTPTIRPRITRRLQCQQPTVQTRYLHLLADQLVRKGIPEQVAYLQQREQTLPVEIIAEQWEEIDFRRVQAMLYADRHCRKLRLGQVPWTPDFQLAARQYQFWSIFRAQKRRFRPNMRFLVRKAAQAQLTLAPLHLIPIEVIKEQQQLAKDHYNQLKESALLQNTPASVAIATSRRASGSNADRPSPSV
jgi:hypothetical protein